MANTAQARKRARQNDKQRAHNASLKSSFRTAIKKIMKAVLSGDKKVAKETFDSNVAILVGAMAFGFLTLHWSIPLSSIFISFPVVHQLLLARILGPVKSLLLTLPLTIFAAVSLYYYWP